MKNLIFILFAIVSLSPSAFAQRGFVVVTRNYNPKPVNEKVTIVLNWNELLNHNIISGSSDFTITDSNFGKQLSKQIVDANNDQKPDEVVIEYVFASDEPQFGFSVVSNDRLFQFAQTTSKPDSRISVTYLSNYNTVVKSDGEIKNWPDKIIESTMSIYPDPSKLPIYAPGNWSYEYAFFLNAMFVRWQENKLPTYFSYTKKWADRFVSSKGELDPKHYNVNEYRLDDLLPGRLYISLYEATKDQKYRNAADQLKYQLQYQPRTSDGGYWHKQIYPYQMWLDGIYMADIFSMQYGKAFNEPKMFNEAMQQIRLVLEHNGDKESGLLYHGWDESGNDVWADEDYGTSPEFWSRGIGWYQMALLECIDYMPLENPDRKVLGTMFRDLSKAILKYQDAKTGLWYQVINKGYEPRNWIETSASAMFAYSFAKGHAKGILDKSYLDAAKKAFETMKTDYIFFDDQGRIYLDGTVKIGTLNTKTSKGDFDYYVGTERRVNDYKGLGALLYLAEQLD